jgi:L-threonylcarbamoyladenylate synthase
MFPPLSMTHLTDSAYIGIRNPGVTHLRRFKMYLIVRDKNEYAQKLFSFFRECDAKGIKTIYAQKVRETGIGFAIMNRLRKAAAIH